jgi:hypothetical protein
MTYFEEDEEIGVISFKGILLGLESYDDAPVKKRALTDEDQQSDQADDDPQAAKVSGGQNKNKWVLSSSQP